MKVLLINGSPRINGNTSHLLQAMINEFKLAEVEVELINIGTKAIRGCIACNKCSKIGKCVFSDLVNEIAPKFEEADGVVIGSPVYYASANASLVALMTRLFYSTNFDKTMKVGCAIACARRSGLTTTFDELNKFFAISSMPIATSQYWNGAHGSGAGEVMEDEEGLQTMRTLAKNMIFLMRSIQLGKEKYGLPTKEQRKSTNFIR